MAESKQFRCLRCEARFMMSHDPKVVVERTCPKCGSNSVRLDTVSAGASAPKPGAGPGRGKP